MNEVPRKPFARNGFWRGFTVGFGAPAFVVAAALGFMHVVEDAPGPKVWIFANGAAMTRAGAARFVAVGENTVTITCNDACDDLHLRQEPLGLESQVRVLDASGGCIRCDINGYVETTADAPRLTWRIDGQPLEITGQIADLPPIVRK